MVDAKALEPRGAHVGELGIGGDGWDDFGRILERRVGGWSFRKGHVGVRQQVKKRQRRPVSRVLSGHC